MGPRDWGLGSWRRRIFGRGILLFYFSGRFWREGRGGGRYQGRLLLVPILRLPPSGARRRERGMFFAIFGGSRCSMRMVSP
jgi:hypothetical protein